MARSAVRCGVLLAVFMAVGLLPSAAVADRAFGPRFTRQHAGRHHDRGELDRVLPRRAARLRERPQRRGGAVSANNNNDRTMTWIDADTDPATFDSSSADLALPAGARVLFAGLYYGGKLTAGNGGSPPPNPGARNTVRFKAPGDTAYRTVTASQIDESSTQYQGFANVTAIVDGAGAGHLLDRERAARHRDNSGGQLGGWALVVAYGDPDAPSRNLSIFDGMQTVSSAAVTIPLSGFQTPLSGPVIVDGRDRRLRGGSGDHRRRGAAPGAVRGIHRAVECRQPGTTGDLGVELERLQLDDLERRRARHLAHAELPEQPRLRRRPVQDDERARQRADEHAGAALDQRRRLPAGRGDDRHRPVRAQDHRDEDRQ